MTRTGEIRDVLVLGGGPAGCAAAIELARSGLTVAVLERSRYADDRIGDTLPPDVAPWLARLGLTDVVRTTPGIESPGVLSLWGGTVVGETDFVFNPYGPGRHIDRTRLDAALADAAERTGATVVRGATLRACRAAPDGWTVTADRDGELIDWTGRWVIDATGRAAWFVRRQGVKPVAVDRLVGVVARVDGESGADRRLVLEAVPDGWWYYAPLPSGRAVATFLTDSDLLPSGDQLRPFWDQQRTASRLVGARFAMSNGADRLRIVAASARWSGTVVGPGWLAAGDAAASPDPLSGSGISRALTSGWEAARSLMAARAGDAGAPAEYQRAAETEYRTYLRERARVYGRVTDWLDRPFWHRRMARPPAGAGTGQRRGRDA